MSEDIGAAVSKELEEAGPSVAIALEFGVQSYFDILRGLVEDFAGKKGMKCIYITSSVPASTILTTVRGARDKDVRSILYRLHIPDDHGRNGPER